MVVALRVEGTTLVVSCLLMSGQGKFKVVLISELKYLMEYISLRYIHKMLIFHMMIYMQLCKHVLFVRMTREGPPGSCLSSLPMLSWNFTVKVALVSSPVMWITSINV